MAGTCWLIGKNAADGCCAAGHFARLRGSDVRQCDQLESIPGRVHEPTMIAIGASRLHALSPGGKQHLAGLTERGAAVYVRGVPGPADLLDLAPFARSSVTIAREDRGVGYRFPAGPTLLGVLAGEETQACAFAARGAEGLPAQAENLLMLRYADGNERSGIFGLRYGKGYVIYDLHCGDEDCSEAPLVERLADPGRRHQTVGALFAADCAIPAEGPRLPPFNLTIDDRPVKFDHFNVAGVGALLQHIEEVCPGAHTDFAWTPWHTNPCHGYLEVMKQFSAGFVWHGFYRHVDHSAIADPGADFAKGRRLVGEIEERFGVRLQRIMIFPFERATAEEFRLLQEAGFLASVEQPGNTHQFDPHLPPYLECSLPSSTDPSCGFTILYRYRAATLTRDRMLAMAALGLPIIAYAHPDELGLRRFSRLLHRESNLAHFDPVLRFAASKGLPPRSLEEIAIEVKAAHAQYAL